MTVMRLQRYQNALVTRQMEKQGQISTRESVLKRLRELEGKKAVITVPIGTEGDNDGTDE